MTVRTAVNRIRMSVRAKYDGKYFQGELCPGANIVCFLLFLLRHACIKSRTILCVFTIGKQIADDVHDISIASAGAGVREESVSGRVYA